jgi:transmembrane sensor
MTTRSEHIRLLFMEQLTGTLSETDSEELADLLATNAEARAVWAALEEEASVLNANSLDPQAELAAMYAAETDHKTRITKGVNGRNSTVIMRRFSANRQPLMRAAAALMLAAAAGLYFIFRSAPAPPLTENKTYQPKRRQVQLKVKGRLLPLTGDNAIQQLLSGDVQLQNDTNGLAYTDNGSNDELNSLLVPFGMDYHITLSDGTEVWLDAVSCLRFPFSFTGNKREVYLDSGKAYFKVAGNSNKSFMVHTLRMSVQVLGTAFNINAYGPGEVTSLVHGAIIVTGYDRSKVTLTSGKEAVYGGQGGLQVRDFKAAETLSWMKGRYYFHRARLADLSATMERWFDVQFMFDQPALANAIVTGMVEKHKLPEFLSDLQTTSHIDYYFTGRQLHFYRP